MRSHLSRESRNSARPCCATISISNSRRPTDRPKSFEVAPRSGFIQFGAAAFGRRIHLFFLSRRPRVFWLRYLRKYFVSLSWRIENARFTGSSVALALVFVFVCDRQTDSLARFNLWRSQMSIQPASRVVAPTQRKTNARDPNLVGQQRARTQTKRQPSVTEAK